MATIRILPPEVINRIAAGEVVERPASVLKELVENSVDAGATDITVELEDGGKRLIRVRDNGSGIAADDLPLAFASHATSKLGEGDLELNVLGMGLLGVATLGFRGEALASISAVAAVEVISRTHGTMHACRFRAGDAEPEPSAGESGTVIEVRDLFHNTPARRKFLRGASTELSHSLQQFTRLALGYPGIRFRLLNGRKRLLDLPAADHLRQRLAQLLGEDAAGELLEVEDRSPGRREHRSSPASRPAATGLSLRGFVGSPRLHRRDAREQHFFVNGRWIRDRMLAHALRAAYEGFQIPGKQPLAYLFLDLPPGDVDVNVHPTKVEVRFRESSEVYRLVRGAVRRALERVAAKPEHGGLELEDFAAELDARGGLAGLESRDTGPADTGPADTGPADTRDAPPAGSSPAWSRPSASNSLAATPRRSTPAGDFAADFVELGTEPPSGAALHEAYGDAAASITPAPAADFSDFPALGSVRRAIQLLKSYLLLESPDGIALIDQHALHEKILFEEIHRRLSEGVVESQRLLVPDVMELPADLMALLETPAAKLAPFGFQIEPFGERAAAVHAIPALFDREAGRTEPREIVRAVLECLKEGSGEEDEAERGEGEAAAGGTVGREAPEAVRKELRKLASTIACKRAVKAGTPLTPQEVQRLLERCEAAEDPRYCPHGRPTTVFLSRREIEKRFDRK